MHACWRRGGLALGLATMLAVGANVPARSAGEEGSAGEGRHSAKAVQPPTYGIETIVFVPAGTTISPGFESTVASGLQGMQGWMIQQSGGYRLRYLPSPAEPRIALVHGRKSTEEYGGSDRGAQLVAELLDRGMWRPNSKFLVFDVGYVEGSVLCGEAFSGGVSVDNPLSSEPVDENKGDDFGFVFLGAQWCDLTWGTAERPGRAETVAMHELIHGFGFVELGSPHYCLASNNALGHVCTAPIIPSRETALLDPESVDVMWPAILHPLSDTVLDRGRDDYFMAPYNQLLGRDDLSTSPYLERP